MRLPRLAHATRWPLPALCVALVIVTFGCNSDEAKGASEATNDTRTSASVSENDAAFCGAKAVLDEHCTVCHDGKGTAGTPMGLTSYSDLTARSAAFPKSKIFERVSARMHDTKRPMPPQGSLTDAELKAVDAWIEADVPGSDATKCATSSAQSAPDDAAEWPAECEEFYKLTARDSTDPSQPYRFPANSEAHPQFVFDAPWGDEEVQALAMKPISDNRKILHHWILYQNVGGRAFLTGWAPGKDKREPLPDDVGLFLPSGKQSLRLDMHYFNLGAETREEQDASGVEICVVRKPKFRAKTATVFMGFTSIGAGLPPVLAPANTVNHEVTATCTVNATEPVHLLTASPHAHKLATHMKFTAKVGGKDVLLHDGPFAFEEQQSYALEDEVILNTGDTVTTVCSYTNPSAQNVTFGENTGNEMCFNFAVYYPMGALSCSGGGLLGGGLGGLLGGGAGGFFGGAR